MSITEPWGEYNNKTIIKPINFLVMLELDSDQTESQATGKGNLSQNRSGKLLALFREKV